MKNYGAIFFVIILPLFSCDYQKEKIKDLDVINDVFSDLFINHYSFEDYRDYKRRVYTEDELEKDDTDSLYFEYKKNKLLKEKLNVFIYSKISPVNIKDIDLIEGINDYEILNLEEVRFNPKEQIKLPEKVSLSSFDEATIAAYKFSRVYFNKNKERAFFVVKLTCFDGCYNEHIIFVAKKGDKWIVEKKVMIATS